MDSPNGLKFVARHWRGELSLGVSYWICGSLIGALVGGGIAVLVASIDHSDIPLREYAFAAILLSLFSLAVWIWSVVGIWRSASKHASRGGKPVWAGLAKFSVVLGGLRIIAYVLNSLAPQLQEYALIAVGHDPLGNVSVQVAADGKSVIVRGALGEGSAAKVTALLDATPAARTVVLNSNGGRLREARDLAQEIQSRDLNTYVQGLCASACTYVFLAGKDRASTPNARIGFHQPSFPGMDPDQQRLMTEQMLNFYKQAGLPSDFVDTIRRTPPEKMWYPSQAEMVRAGVVTRTSLGGEAAIFAASFKTKEELRAALLNDPTWAHINRRFPDTIPNTIKQVWDAKVRGATDAELFGILRSSVSALYPRILLTADAATLDRFLTVMLNEIKAARAVGPKYCVAFLGFNSELKGDPSSVLPSDVLKQEREFLSDALTQLPSIDLNPPSEEQKTRALVKAMSSLSKEEADVIAAPTAHTDKPDLLCEASYDTYVAISALPPKDRHAALSAMFQ